MYSESSNSAKAPALLVAPQRQSLLALWQLKPVLLYAAVCSNAS